MTKKELESINNMTQKCADFFDTMATATTIIFGMATVILAGVELNNDNLGVALLYLSGGAFVCIINYFTWFAGACFFYNLYSLNNKDKLEEDKPVEPKKWSERNKQ